MPTSTAIDPISASLRLIIERMHKHVGDRLYDLRSEAEAILPIACIEATTPAKPAKLLAIIAWAVLGLSDGDRRMVELHLAVARLSPERRGRLLDRFDGSVDALADDLQAYMQGADVPHGSPEDVLLAASHVTAYVETDEARFGADGKPSDSDELWDRNGVPYALDGRGNPIHDAAMDYLAPPRTADGQVPAVTPAWSVEMSAGPAVFGNIPSRNEFASADSEGAAHSADFDESEDEETSASSAGCVDLKLKPWKLISDVGAKVKRYVQPDDEV